MSGKQNSKTLEDYDLEWTDLRPLEGHWQNLPHLCGVSLRSFDDVLFASAHIAPAAWQHHLKLINLKSSDYIIVVFMLLNYFKVHPYVVMFSEMLSSCFHVVMLIILVTPCRHG